MNLETKLLFSIVVPVYNVEQYLDKCLQSLTHQTFKNFEVILVDDGSTDSSGKICDKYAEKYDFMKVYHKENGGSSSARNYGIEKANGQYIGFLDSDDYWNDMCFLKEINDIICTKQYDVIVFGYGEWKDGYFKPIMNFDAYRDQYDYSLNELITNNWIISSACTKFVRLDVVKQNIFDFRFGVTSEDVEWTAKLLTVCKNYTVYPNNVYVYRQQENSITHNINKQSIVDLYNNIENSLDYLNKLKTENTQDVFNYLAYQYITLLNLYAVFFYGDKELLVKVKSMSYLLNNGTNDKVKLVALFNKLFGFKIMLLILKIFLKVRKSNR